MRTGRSSIALLATSVVLGACAGKPTLQLPAPEEQPSILRLEETNESGRRLVDCRCSYSFADINSQLLLRAHLDSATVGQVAGATSTSDTIGEVLRALNDSVSTLRQLLQRLDSIPAVATRIAAAVGTGNRDALRVELREHARLVTAALDYVAAVNPELADSLLAKPEMNYGSVGAFLRERAEGLSRRVQELGSAVRDRALRDALRVQLWAMLYSPGRDPVQVHIDNYDNLQRGDPHPVDKLGFTRTPAEQADIDRGLREYRGLVNALDSLRGGVRTIGRTVVALVQDVRSTLENGRRAFANLPSSTELRDLVRTLGTDIRTRASAESLRALVATLTSLDTLRAWQDSALRQFRLSPTPDAPFGFAAEALGGAAPALERLSDAATALSRRFVTDLPGRVRVVAETALREAAGLTGPARGRVDSLVARLRDDWAPAFESLQTALGRWQGLRNSVAGLHELAGSLGLVGAVAGARVAPEPTELVTLPMADAPPGTLDLTSIGPRDGDRLVATLRVLRADPLRPLLDVNRTIRIRTYGWHRRWQAGLGFTRQSRADGILPGVALSWIVHHRSRPNSTENAQPRDGHPLLGFLDVGIGLTSVAITRGSDLQLGFGPTLSLFGDALVIGGGLNLEEQKGFLLFATPLLDLARRASGGN